MAISQKLRFEVLRSDHFTCQYCGRRAPDVGLQVDHITPRAAGGTDDRANLTTSCVDCNQGKSANPLIDMEEFYHHHRRIVALIEGALRGELPFDYIKSPSHVFAWAGVCKLMDDYHPESPYRKQQDTESPVN